jgi:hypothetical protein
VTNIEYAYRWQMAASRILGELISEGQKLKLPPLMWTLATTGALTGEAVSLASTAPEQRAAVTAWARHLGAKVTEVDRSDGRVSLNAHFERDGEPRGAIRAELFPDLDTYDQ